MGELGEKMHIIYTHSMFKSLYNPVEKTTNIVLFKGSPSVCFVPHPNQ